jgi:FkbM family methyltransferase
MNVRRAIVTQLDKHAPRFMSAVRYQVHVEWRGEIVYPDISRPMFQRMQSQTASAIDVGANVGIYARYLSKHFQNVFAIEPIPYLVSNLNRSLPVNCKAVSVAVGNTEGEVSIRVPVDANGNEMPALSTLSERNNLDLMARSSVVEHKVQCKRLDSVAAPLGNLSFIKVDVEGFEGEVLKGATALLSMQRPVFQIEISRAHNPDYSDVLALMQNADFASFAMLKHGLHADVQRHLDEQPTNVGDSTLPGGCWDYLFVPREKVEALTHGLLVNG